MKVQILVRFDDFCPTMNFMEWEKAQKILEKYDVKPLLGIIPECNDPDLYIEEEHREFWKYILELQKKGYALAMHGCHHVFNTNKRGILSGGNKSEFAGLPYELQDKQIKIGKRILEEHGIYTDIFFAPAHSYDENTLKVLSKNGFKYISDGMSNKAYIRRNVICLPCRSSGVPVIRGGGYYTAVFHVHEWVRPDKAEGYSQLINLCEKYRDEIVDFDTYKCQPLGNTIIQEISERSFVIWKRNIKPVGRKIRQIKKKG